MSSRGNIHQFPHGTPQGKSGNGNGGGDNTLERLARLEERMSHLATYSQIQETNLLIEKVRGEINTLRGELGILKWIGGILIIGIISALVRLYS